MTNVDKKKIKHKIKKQSSKFLRKRKLFVFVTNLRAMVSTIKFYLISLLTLKFYRLKISPSRVHFQFFIDYSYHSLLMMETSNDIAISDLIRQYERIDILEKAQKLKEFHIEIERDKDLDIFSDSEIIEKFMREQNNE